MATIAAVQLIRGGDFRIVIALLLVAAVLTIATILLTRRSMARGRTAQQIIGWWFNLPIIGRFLRFGDAMNSRMGRGSTQLFEDARERDSSGGDEAAP